MLTWGAFAIVVFGYYYGVDALLLVCLGCLRHFLVCAVELIFNTVALAIEGIDSSHEEVIRDVFEMSSELKPWASHRNMVSGALALCFYEEWHIVVVVAIPLGKRFEFLQALRIVIDNHLNILVFFRSNEESRLFEIFGYKASWREGESIRLIEHHALPYFVLKWVGGRIEIKTTWYSHSDCHFRTSDKGIGVWITIGTTSEITIETGNNGILAVVIVSVTFPLSDTWSAGVSHDDCSYLTEVIENTISFSRILNLLRTRIDDKLSLYLEVFLSSLTGYACCTCKVLIAGVGATTYKTYFNIHRIVVGRTFGTHLRDWCSSIGSERTIKMWLYLGEVDVQHLIVIHIGVSIYLGVRHKICWILLSENSYFFTTCLAQIFISIIVIGKDWTSGSKFGSHITYCSLTRCWYCLCSFAKIFKNGVGATLYSEHAKYLEDNILWWCPTR